MRIKVMYFASLRDYSKVPEEVLETNATTVEQLFDVVNKKYNFKLSRAELRAAQNENYVSWDSPINPNDTIVFIPPVAGG